MYNHSALCFSTTVEYTNSANANRANANGHAGTGIGMYNHRIFEQ